MKINQSLGISFALNQKRWLKANIELLDIDTEKPIDEQLQAADPYIKMTYDYLLNHVDNQIDDLVSQLTGEKVNKEDE